MRRRLTAQRRRSRGDQPPGGSSTAAAQAPARVVLLDNRDSFVYNLVDQFAVLGAGIEVYRNTVPAARVLKALEPTREESAHGERPVLALSPGPGHPRTSGCLMELVITALADSIPTLGICLGFQALVEACGGSVVVVAGDERAMKVTTPTDLALAELLLEQQPTQGRCPAEGSSGEN